MSVQRRGTHPGVAAVLSFVFSGIGQIYNGEIKKGLILVFLSTLGLVFVTLGGLVLVLGFYQGFLTMKLAMGSLVSLVLGGAVICWVGIYSIYDAYENAL